MCVDSGHQRHEVPERVVRGGSLREAAIGFHLHGVDEVGELDRVLDEEHRDVVADEIPVALLACRTSRRSPARRAACRPSRRRRRRWRSARTPAPARPSSGTATPWSASGSAPCTRSSRGRPSRERARSAPGSARGRSGRSSRGGRSPRAGSGRVRPPRSEFWLSLSGTPWFVVRRSPPRWWVSPPAPSVVVVRAAVERFPVLGEAGDERGERDVGMRGPPGSGLSRGYRCTRVLSVETTTTTTALAGRTRTGDVWFGGWWSG